MEAHLKMVHLKEWKLENAFSENKDPRMAAVMMLFTQRMDDTFSFNCSESYEGVHSGQIAFWREMGNRRWDFSVTALRETHEEVNTPHQMEIIKLFTPTYTSK
jgi:hypothetical protein